MRLRRTLGVLGMSFNGWDNGKLGDILNFRRGHDLPQKNMEKGIFPVIGSNGVIGYHNEFTTPGPCITVGRSGNVGTPFLSKNDSWAHNTTLYIDDFKGNDPKFIYYFLQTLNLKNYAGGSAVPTLNRNHIHPIDIIYPINFEEQKAIANILSSLDEKIEVNNQINKKLEEVAQTIFKQWFVDFEFPDEEGKPYKSSGGVMVESELGMIPEGWKVMKIGELSDVSIGKTPPRKENEWFSQNNKDLKWISIKDMGEAGTYIIKTKEYLTREAVHKFNVKIIPDNTVILSFKLTVGRLALTVGEMLSNEAIAHFVLKDDSSITNEYLYIYLLNFNFDSLGSTSSIATATNSKIVKTIPILQPNSEVLTEFMIKIRPIFEMLKSNTLEINQLESCKEILLPKLMSGEIRVPIDKE